MKRRGLALKVTAAVAGAMLVVACGSSGGDNGSSAASTTSAAASNGSPSASSPAGSSVSSDAPSTSGSSQGGSSLQQVAGFTTPPSDALVEAAKAEGGNLVWYESTPDELIPQLVKGFTDKYPWVKLQHVNLAGSLMNARVAQEVEAGAAGADVGTNDAGPELVERGMLLKVDWAADGIPKGMPQTDYAVATAATIYCIQYNTNLVTAEEAPKSWDDLLDPKWAGKIGYYAQPYFFSQLVSVWGEEKTVDYVTKFKAQNPSPEVDSAAVTQLLAAGEFPIALTVYQTYLRAVTDKLPVGANIPDPTALTVLYSYIPKTAAHPNTAQLFLNWLGSEEGQTSYFNVAKRANPLYPDTEYGKILAGKQLASWGPEQATKQTEWLKKFQDQLQR